jgi:UDP-N-acetylglucosamine 1-carboxyvinyltransferase
MQRFVVKGGDNLHGEVRISGAKNAALPIIAASLLNHKRVVLDNVPDLVDVRTMIELVEYIGSKVEFKDNTLAIETPEIKNIEAPYDIVRKMRASYYVLGALLARSRQAKVSLPGGCAIGPRPVDLHIKGLRSIGVDIDIEEGFIKAKAKKMTGREINLQGPKGTSVGATINVMIAAAGAEGDTIINSAACEPEVVDVADFLNAMGCHITGQGTHTIIIKGGVSLENVQYAIIPDRIEAGTFAVAAVMTNGHIRITHCRPDHMTSVLDLLEEAGGRIIREKGSLTINGYKGKKAVNVYVAPYPGFPTDMQAQFMAFLCTVPGTSTIKETIFENRFMQAVELMRMGADITIEGDMAVIRGVKKLSSARLMASDLRASASLVLAGLVAKGETAVRRIYHLDRGYENFEVKLQNIGAHIIRQAE